MVGETGGAADGDEITVRPAVPGDAPGLVDCFVRCYGATYPNAELYDAVDLAARLADGRLCSVVAVVTGQGPGGRVVGHTGLTIREPDALAPEAGNTVVDPAMRGQGLLGRLGAALAELARSRGSCGYVHYPTGAHHVMQKASVASGGIETGVMEAYIPADTDYVGIDQGGGRLPATIVYQPFSPAPARDVYLPEPYRELLAELVAELRSSAGLARRVVDPTAGGPERSNTSFRPVGNERRGLRRIEVASIGADLDRVLGAGLGDPRPAVDQLDLPLHEPAVHGAVATARRVGFHYCGLLPEFGRGDVLRLQRVEGGHRTDEATLLSPRAKRLLAAIEADAEAVAGDRLD